MSSILAQDAPLIQLQPKTERILFLLLLLILYASLSSIVILTRIASGTLQGYYLEQFSDCFSRYIPPSQNGTPEQGNNISKLGHFQNGTNTNDVPLKKYDNALESLDCSVVPDGKGGTGEKNKQQVLRGTI